MEEVREIDDRLWKRLMKRKAEDLCFIFGDETPDVISDYVKRRKLVAREERAEPPDRREVTEEASIRRSLSPNYVDDPNARINELEPEKNAREEREEPPERREVAEEPSIRRPPSLNYEDDTDALIKEVSRIRLGHIAHRTKYSPTTDFFYSWRNTTDINSLRSQRHRSLRSSRRPTSRRTNPQTGKTAPSKGREKTSRKYSRRR